MREIDVVVPFEVLAFVRRRYGVEERARLVGAERRPVSGGDDHPVLAEEGLRAG